MCRRFHREGAKGDKDTKVFGLLNSFAPSRFDFVAKITQMSLARTYGSCYVDIIDGARSVASVYPFPDGFGRWANHTFRVALKNMTGQRPDRRGTDATERDRANDSPRSRFVASGTTGTIAYAPPMHRSSGHCALSALWQRGGIRHVCRDAHVDTDAQHT